MKGLWKKVVELADEYGFCKSNLGKWYLIRSVLFVDGRLSRTALVLIRSFFKILQQLGSNVQEHGFLLSQTLYICNSAVSKLFCMIVSASSSQEVIRQVWSPLSISYKNQSLDMSYAWARPQNDTERTELINDNKRLALHTFPYYARVNCASMEHRLSFDVYIHTLQFKNIFCVMCLSIRVFW